MIQYFNKFGNYELPKITLCAPDKRELYALPLASNIKNTLKYNALERIIIRLSSIC